MPKIKVYLFTPEGYHRTVYVYGTAEDIQSVLDNTKKIIRDWLDDKEVPNTFEDCYCDADFYIKALHNNFKVEEDTFDGELLYML